MSDCIFCKIAAGDIPADLVHTDADIVAFRDIAPVAPVHLVVIPRAHHADIAALTAAAPELAGRLTAVAAQLGADHGADGFRLVLNTGPAGGQTVGHVHAHVLAGRNLHWPPG